MTIPTTGAISIADLNTEFGGGYSLGNYFSNGSYTPSNTIGVPASSSNNISFDQFRQANPTKCWTVTLKAANGYAGIQANGSCKDASGNIYFVGPTGALVSGSGVTRYHLTKVDPAGNMLWQRLFIDTVVGVCYISSRDVVCIIGTGNRSGTSTHKAVTFDVVAGDFRAASDIVTSQYRITPEGVSSDGTNVYICGEHLINPGDYDFSLIKLDGLFLTTTWQTMRGTANGFGSEIWNGISVDSFYGCITAGNGFTGSSGPYFGVIAKWSTATGAALWSRRLTNASSNVKFLGCKLYPTNGNIYAWGYTEGGAAGGVDGLIVKYNNSGTLQWQKTIGDAGNNYIYSLAIDSSTEDLYVVAGNSTSGANGVLHKLDSGGVVQWTRSLGTATRDERFSAVELITGTNPRIIVGGHYNAQASFGYTSGSAFIKTFPMDANLPSSTTVLAPTPTGTDISLTYSTLSYSVTTTAFTGADAATVIPVVTGYSLTNYNDNTFDPDANFPTYSFKSSAY